MSRDIKVCTRNDEIYERAKTGEHISDLAREYGISREYVRTLIHYRDKRDKTSTILDKADAALKEYMKEKIDVLDELGIKLAPEQVRYLTSLKSEIDIDNYARTLIFG